MHPKNTCESSGFLIWLSLMPLVHEGLRDAPRAQTSEVLQARQNTRALLACGSPSSCVHPGW